MWRWISAVAQSLLVPLVVVLFTVGEKPASFPGQRHGFGAGASTGRIAYLCVVRFLCGFLYPVECHYPETRQRPAFHPSHFFVHDCFGPSAVLSFLAILRFFCPAFLFGLFLAGVLQMGIDSSFLHPCQYG